ERLLGQLVVCRHGRGDDDRFQRVVSEHLGEVECRLGLRESSPEKLELFRGSVAHPGKVGEVVEVACQVRTPVAQAGDADTSHSFQTFLSSTPLVAFRKSTITWPRLTTSA